MYRVPGGYPQATPQGPRSLHFRGKRPIPRLPELAHAAALGRKRPLSATSPPAWFRRSKRTSDVVAFAVLCTGVAVTTVAESGREACGRPELRALTFSEARYGAFSAKMQTAGSLPVPSGYPPGTFRRGLIWKIRQNPAKFGQNLAKFVKISEIWRKN